MVADRQTTEPKFDRHPDLTPILRAVCHATSATVAALAQIGDLDVGLIAASGLEDGEELLLPALIDDWRRGKSSSPDAGLVLFGAAIVPTVVPASEFVLIAYGRTGQDTPREGCIAALADIAKLAQHHIERFAAQPLQAGAHAWTSQSPLSDAIDAFPDAIAVFDAHERFQYWNQAFQELYESEGAPLSVGVTFEEHLRVVVGSGKVLAAAGREEEWIKERLARFRADNATYEHQLRGKRWVRVQDRPLRNGGKIGIRTDITALVEREQSFRLLFDANPAPMLMIDFETLRILAVNDAATTFYEYDREAFLKLSLPDIRPDHRNMDSRIALETIDEPGWSEQLRVNKTGSGAERIVKVQARMFDYEGRQAVLAAVTDFTKHNVMQRERDEARAFLSQIVDEIPSILFVKDGWDKGNYLMTNKAGERATGLPREDIIGRSDVELFGPEYSADILETDQLTLLESTFEGTCDKKIPRSDGEFRWMRVRKVSLPDVSTGAPRYVLGIAEDVTEIKAKEDHIAHHAYHDALTDLPNRLQFRERLDRELIRLATSRAELAVMLLDLDEFKPVNDRWGHHVGDALLKEVARRVQTIVHPNHLAARLSGDEFAVLISPARDADEAAWIASQLVASLAQPYDIDGHEIHISASVGVAMMPRQIIEATVLMRQADDALYEAKREGRNQFRFAIDEADGPKRDSGDHAGNEFIRRTAM